SYTIPKGTIVKTSDGTAFLTAEQVLLSVAALSGTPPNLTVQCTTNDVDVTAVEAGEDGNVAAGAIKVVPARYNRKVISVSNRAATTGGTRTEFARVAQKDVDAALVALEAELETEVAADLQDPDLAPPGTTIFPETALAGEPTPTVDPATLVGQEVETFTLGLTATGTVLAVDESPIEAIAEAQLAADVDDGYALVEGSTRVEVGEGTVTEGLVDFPVIGSARQVRPIDAAALELAVLGLTKAEAEAALAPYGEAVVVLWPGWVTAVPTLHQRVRLVVAEPVDVTPQPTPKPSPSPTLEPVDSLQPDASGDVPASEPVPSG
ncbi:MAG: baseplate J/gp47 family protein, partial [Chloroflexi bacterium]|nr:baseplate J/gp47 family protein [Chloroflexota bacterium]